MHAKQIPISSEQKWIPDGFHFLGPEESKNRRILLQKFSEIFERHGFSEITLPSFDYTSSFAAYVDPEDESLLRAKDGEGKDLSPGVDLTLQVVKGMAARSHWEENQSVYYIAKKIRDHKKRNASRREILQIGAESLGKSDSLEVERHIQILDELWFVGTKGSPLTYVFGHSTLFLEIIRLLNWGGAYDATLKQFLYTKNLPELLSLAARLGVNERDTEILKLFLTPIKFFEFGSFRNKLLNLLTLEEKTKSETILNEILNFSQKLKKPNINYIWDPSLLRDVSYYTGIQFQGYMLGNPEPVFAGGVYDHLYETFSGISKPSSGFAIHLDPIEELINKQK